MPVYKFQLKSTGKTYDMPWDDDDTEPTALEKKQYAWEQDNPSMGKKAWDWVNKPLTDVPSKVGKAAADYIDTPSKDEPSRIPGTNMTWKGLGAGMTEGAGNVLSSLTSPLSLGLMATGGGAATAAKRGLTGTASALSGLEAAGNAAVAGGGAAQAYQGAKEGDYGKMGAGALGLLGGGLGMRSAYSQAMRAGAAAPAVAETAARETPKPKVPLRLGKGSVVESGPSSLDPTSPIDAEFYEPNKGQVGGAASPGGLPPLTDRGLPPKSRTFYGGKYGVSPDIEAPEQPGRTFQPQTRPKARNWADAQAQLRDGVDPGLAVVPQEPIPDIGAGNPRDILEQNSPYGINYQRKGGATKPPAAPPVAADVPGPYAKASDENVSFLAEQGDQAARAEALKRPSLRDRFPDAEIAEKAPTIGEFFKKALGDERGFIKNPFRKRDPEAPNATQDAFTDWVNTRRASKIEGILKKKEFKDLDSLGINGILDFQSGVRDGRLSDVAKYFDEKFNTLNKEGVKLDYRENYLPQMWEDDPEQVKQLYARLGLKPSFSMARVLENYQMGIEKGLTPKFKTISDLLGWYEGKANKAVADRHFFDYLKDNDLLRPKGQGNPDWETLDPDHFPSQKFKSKDKLVEVPMQAPPEVAQIVNNYLRMPESQLNWKKPGAAMQWMADKASLAKNLSMSAGIPGTAVNAHGLNIMARTVIGNPREAFRAGRYLLQPSSAGKYLDSAMESAPWAVRQGLTLSTEGHELGTVGSTNLAGKAFQGFLKTQGKMFEDPLFQNVIPALKLKHFNDMTADLVKGGLGRQAAGKQAADFTNKLYGGINWDAMGRSRDLGNLARMFTLAPDWLATNYGLGKGMAKALVDPGHPLSKAYGKMARNIVGAYLAADVVNNAMAGHHMWENQPGHALDVQMGKSDGKDRWLRPFGTAEDFIRLPFDAVSAVINKQDLGTSFDIMKNRMSVPARAGVDLLMKRDRANRPLTGKDDYGRQMSMKKQLGGIAGELGAVVTPPYVQSGIDLATGRSGYEEALMGMGELPFRYTHSGKKNNARRGRR